MHLHAIRASHDDIDELVRLYRDLEREMVALKEMWRLADGLPDPIDAAFKALIDDPDTIVLLGFIDEATVGFLVGRSESLLPQAGGERVGAIRLIFTEDSARGVGVGEAMIEEFLADMRQRGLRLFDAHVPPGHRIAKNFFESNGFKARSIVMHHDDHAD